MAESTYCCENCGGIMVFDAATQTLKCPNCDTAVEIITRSDGIVEHRYDGSAAAAYRVREKTSSTMQCNGCGASIELDKDSTAAICPYCGSGYVMADKQEAAIIPDGVIPFQIDRQAVKIIFGRWIKSLKMAPGELKALYQQGNVQGRYIPFWTFDADTRARYSGMGGRDHTEHYKNKDGQDATRVVTDWYPVSGMVTYSFDDLLINGTANLKASLVAGMDDYRTDELKPYSADYFRGFLSETYTIDLKTAHSTARSKMESELRRMAEGDILSTYDHAKNISINPEFRDETYKHVMVPLYATSYSYKNKNYTVLINGQNGEIKGEYPKSPVKIALLIIAAIIAAVAMWFFANSDSSEVPGYGADIEYTDYYTI